MAVPNSPTSKNTQRTLHQQSLERTHQKLPASHGKGATENLFELLERCSQRLDDQRCVLPSYFSQVSLNKLYVNLFDIECGKHCGMIFCPKGLDVFDVPIN